MASSRFIGLILIAALLAACVELASAADIRPSPATAANRADATERRLALVIGNGAYGTARCAIPSMTQTTLRML